MERVGRPRLAGLAFWAGPRLWRLASDHDFLTLGDYLEWRYSSAVRATVSLILWSISLAILAAQLIGVASILQVVAGVPRRAGAVARWRRDDLLLRGGRAPQLGVGEPRAARRDARRLPDRDAARASRRPEDGACSFTRRRSRQASSRSPATRQRRSAAGVARAVVHGVARAAAEGVRCRGRAGSAGGRGGEWIRPPVLRVHPGPARNGSARAAPVADVARPGAPDRARARPSARGRIAGAGRRVLRRGQRGRCRAVHAVDVALAGSVSPLPAAERERPTAARGRAPRSCRRRPRGNRAGDE